MIVLYIAEADNAAEWDCACVALLPKSSHRRYLILHDLMMLLHEEAKFYL